MSASYNFPDPNKMTAFEEMGVMPEIGKAIEEMDWSLPTDVQAEAIPLILGGGDVLMAAETGSGKTGAFCLPIIQIVHETMRDIAEGKGANSGGTVSRAKSEWKMNVYDRTESFAVDASGLLCQSRDQQGWHGCRAAKGVHTRGCYYYEVKFNDEGLSRVGWSTANASLELGTDRQGYGFGGTGKKSYGKQFDDYGESFGKNDVIGCLLDLDDYSIFFAKNGESLGRAFTISGNMKGNAFFPAICLKNAEVEVNFGSKPFKFPPPEGYVALTASGAENVRDTSLLGTQRTQQKVKSPNAPYAIIIEPSRELAEQTLSQIEKFRKHIPPPNITPLLCMGGISAKEQTDSLHKGVDVVCGTPGRLEDLISTGQLSLEQIRFFVLDEADGLLSAGYGELINRIYNQIPKVTADGKRLQMIVCSATLHSFDVKKMAEKLMHFPVWIDLKGQDSVPETVHHCVCIVDPDKDSSWKEKFQSKQCIATDEVHAKDRLNAYHQSPEMLSEAVKVLKGEYVVRAILEHKMDRALIFCRTKLDCDNMEKYLLLRGGGARNPGNPFTCVCLHGDRKPPERKANLETFKQGKVKFLICTDVAARGIDISGLPYVINVTLPDEKQNYVHRIGRVGRAERMGLAISFSAACKEKVWYHSNCNTRGRGCYNTNLTDHGGCCIWYNEPQYLADIEEHLGVTIDQVEPDMKVPVNEFDGKVVYGQRSGSNKSSYVGHVGQLASTVRELGELEKKAQTSYLRLRHMKPLMKR